MNVESVPASLRHRLGPAATSGPAHLCDNAREEWSAEIVNLAVERFERRLVEETSSLRGEMGSFRLEVASAIAALRVDMARMETRQLKQSFLFWIGQAVTVAGILAVMLRGVVR
jgi:hypothetical protein